MFSLLSQEEKFMVGVIQGNKELLDDLKKEGFVPAPELMERIDSSHLTEGMKEHLDRQFGIADKPESVSFTLEDVMASVPLRKMYMKDMMELNLEINDRTANDWMEAYQERKTMNNDFILAL
jgi:DNA primase traC